MDVNFEGDLKELIEWANENVRHPSLLDYSEMSKKLEDGIYVVYEKEKLLYVGKTTRSGKVRVRELASDYRSHTLNRKLMEEALRKAGVLKGRLTNRSKAELGARKKISKRGFEEIQTEINARVKRDFKFNFIPCERNLSRMEHWTIALLNPPMND